MRPASDWRRRSQSDPRSQSSRRADGGAQDPEGRLPILQGCSRKARREPHRPCSPRTSSRKVAVLCPRFAVIRAPPRGEDDAGSGGARAQRERSSRGRPDSRRAPRALTAREDRHAGNLGRGANRVRIYEPVGPRTRRIRARATATLEDAYLSQIDEGGGSGGVHAALFEAPRRPPPTPRLGSTTGDADVGAGPPVSRGTGKKKLAR
jgi:hypothetical protein